MSLTKPLPTITGANAPFWEGTRAAELRMQQCQDCKHIRFPINAVCPDCLSENSEWVALSGRGEIFSYVVFHQVYNKAFADDVPYNVALVQLEEGPRMFSNIITADNGIPKVGMPVEVTFEKVNDEVTLPRFGVRDDG